MSALPQPGSGYIRGSGGVSVESGRVGRILVGLLALTLAVLAGVTAYLTANESSRSSDLRAHGVPVRATGAGCSGITSGIGMGTEYYQCRVTYQLGGHAYQELLLHSRRFIDTGQGVDAVAVPGQPALVAPATWQATNRSGSASYGLPIGLGAAASVVTAVWAGVTVRHRRAQQPTSDPGTGTDPSPGTGTGTGTG